MHPMNGYKKCNKKIVEELRNSSIDIVSIMLYGSWARGNASSDSDMDLLVIADHIDSRRNRRHKEIAAIKTKLLGIGNPFDILLLDREECISNFRNHNPLFLDIADHGIILYDSSFFVKGLVKETREYIAYKKIKKVEDGWIYPVKERSPTFLSTVSNKDFSIAMLNDGKRDFEIGKKLIEIDFFDKAVYHFQQSMEKGVKAILICFGIFMKTHFVGEILLRELQTRKIGNEWDKKLENVASASLEIEPEVTWSRYPGIDHDALWIPSEEYARDDAIESQMKVEKCLGLTQDFVDWWFLSKQEGIK